MTSASRRLANVLADWPLDREQGASLKRRRPGSMRIKLARF